MAISRSSICNSQSPMRRPVIASCRHAISCSGSRPRSHSRSRSHPRVWRSRSNITGWPTSAPWRESRTPSTSCRTCHSHWLGSSASRRCGERNVTFDDPRDRWPYFALFAGVLLTAACSSYYHLAPDNARLVWDRLPMTVGFMGLFAAMLTERVNPRLGRALLVPLIFRRRGIGGLLVLDRAARRR